MSVFDEAAYLAAAQAGDYRKVVALQQGLLDGALASIAQNSGDPAQALARLTEIVARLFRVARSGLWLFEESREQLRCLDLFIARDDRHTSGNKIHVGEAPNYFEQIRTDEILLVSDAAVDPRTREFAQGYLPAFGIGALIDAPLHVRRRLLGVLRIEHIGGSRRWHPWERGMASSLAECAGVIVQQGAARSRRPTFRDLRLS